MPTTKQLIATLNVDIARVQAEDAYRRDGVVVTSRDMPVQREHYSRELAAEEFDVALGQGRN